MCDVKDTNTCRRRGGIRRVLGINRLGEEADTGKMGTETIYPTKSACYRALLNRMARYATASNAQYSIDINYTDHYNSWLMSSGYMFNSLSTKSWARTGLREAYFEVRRVLRWTTREGLIEIKVQKGNPSMKQANNLSCYAVYQAIYKNSLEEFARSTESNQIVVEFPRTQMDVGPEKLGEQGDTTQQSDRQINTIITRDQNESKSLHSNALDQVAAIASSEEVHYFPTLTKRWMPLDSLVVKTSDKLGDLIKSYYLPEEFYRRSSTPNLTPFETFIYGRVDIELRIVVNANKFCCGKLLVSSKYDTFQADNTQIGYQSALARNHIIIDLCANNEGVLQIPFRYHRPYVRLVKNDRATLGIRPSKYASVYLHVLSPLQTGTDGPTDVGCRVFFRIKESSYSGMSYRVSVQVDDIPGIVSQTTNRALREVLVGAERVFDQLGKSRNQDKPSQIQALSIIPQPRLNFSGGKGVSDVVPLRVNPHTLTNYKDIVCPTDEPKSFYELARIWGVFKEFTWEATRKDGAVLIDMIIDPTARSYTSDIETEMTPLEYACGNYAFWSGPIELRIDFVSNSFHTGTVQISAEFGRSSTADDEVESSSTYTKVFHLGEQKSVNFRIPYIYDTVMRRTTSNFVNMYNGLTAADDLTKRSMSVAPESKTRVKVRVLNVLRPAASAPQSISCLVFIRAGEKFHMHGLKGFSFIPSNNIVEMDQFPYDYDLSTVAKVKREIKEKMDPKEEHVQSHRTVNPRYRNEWNEYTSEALPQVQMDNGEKETQDTTEDFDVGQTSQGLLTLDNQLNFKDLLRRPTLLAAQLTIPANTNTNSGFFIPLQPPSRQMCYQMNANKKYFKNGFWSPTIASCASTSIVDLFRCWRGGMRYTIVDHTRKEQGRQGGPFYISTIPHSGTRMLGNHTVCGVVNEMPYVMAGMNFTTAIVCPTVNPTITIEAPYETENTWTLTWDEDALRNYAWRDKGDYNAGHLCITSPESRVIDLWWSAADDFELANFYGMPKTLWNGWAYRPNDSHARVQIDEEEQPSGSDFPFKETVTKVTGFVKNHLKPSYVTKAALGMVPIVGVPLVVADTARKVDTFIDETSHHVNRVTSAGVSTLERIGSVADMANIQMGALTQLVGEAVNSITSTIKGLVCGADILYNLFLDILIAWMEKSWKVIGISIVRFFGKFMLGQMDVLGSLMDYATQIADYIQGMVTDTTPRVQLESNTATYIGILAGLVGTMTGVTLDSRHWGGSFASHLGRRLTSSSGVAYLVHVLTFIKNTFACVRDMIMQALGYISPEAAALKKLSEHSEVMDKFVREAQIMTSEVNATMLNQPLYRRRFWFTVLQAHQIQRMLCSINSNVVSYQLSKLCSEVIKMGNEKFLDLSASPVRFEPMVICLEGQAGVGKSHVTEELVDRLLKSVGIVTRSSEKIFYRTSGEKFWSGYRNQPVVVYDEWLNTTDAMRCTDQIAEMMKLKSTSVFIPEMAHLEEKKIRGNPLIIIICCNDAFPNNLSSYATCPRAILRRRDMVMRVSRKDEFRDVDPITCTAEQAEVFRKYEHLHFQVYGKPDQMKSLHLVKKDFETTSEWITQAWKRYYKHQMEQVKIRMARLPEYASNINNMNISDPFTIFYQMDAEMDRDINVVSNGFTHYEVLESALELTLSVVQSPLPEEPITTTAPVAWEDAVAPANTQIGIWGGIAIGVGLYGLIPAWIAKAAVTQLKVWAEQISPLTTMEYYCSVCMETTRCAYVCETSRSSETKHMLCVQCYHSMMEFGDHQHCPICRDPTMAPYFSERDINSLSVFMQLVVRGIHGMDWLLSKFLDYYEWRDRHYCVMMVAEFLMGNLLARANPRAWTGLSLGLNLSRWVRTDNTSNDRWYRLAEGTTLVCQVARVVSLEDRMREAYAAVGVQVDSEDEWGIWNPPVSPRVIPMTQHGEDPFVIVVNEEVVEEFVLRSSPQPLCLHRKLKQYIANATYIGGKWRIRDDDMSRIVTIDPHICETGCVFQENQQPLEDYIELVRRWSVVNARFLRSKYIDYYNSPSEELMREVPDICQPTWMRNTVPPVPSDWWTWLGDIWLKYKNLLIYVGAAMGVIAAMVGAYGLAVRLNSVGSAISQISATAGSPEQSPRNPRHIVRRGGGATRAYFHSEVDTPSIYEVVTHYVTRNTFKINICTGTKKVPMYGTGLFNHCLLIPRHYVRKIREAFIKGSKITGHPLLQPQLEAEIIISNTMLSESEETDLAYMMLPPKFPIFKDIRKFLALDKDLETPITSTGILLANPKSGCEYMREIEVDIYGIAPEQVIVDSNDKNFTVYDVLKYSYSKPGVCGSLLLRENHQRPILSMHFAGIGEGSNGYGFGIILTQEALGNLCTNRAVPTQFDDVKYESVEQAKFVFGDDIHLAYYGSLSKENVPYTPTKTKLVKSLIYNETDLSTIMEPAILDKNDPRYMHIETPLSAGIRKHGVITRDFTPEQIERAGEAYWDLWLCGMKPLIADPKVLTYEQCILGLPTINHYTGVDLSTSAGYPYSLDKSRTKKSDYIRVERDAQLQAIGVEYMDPMLERILQQKRELRKNGIVPHTLFVDTLKDEKRTHEKVMKLGGTRVFCSSPVDYVLECRAYFLHFAAAFMENRFNLMHAVGINPTSEEWTRLTHDLLKRNGKFCTIDYSNFGPGYNSAVAKKAYELIVRWTMEHVREISGDALDERELMCIVYECLQSMHVCNNTVYQQGAGSPSGAFFTTIINTMVNILYLLIAWDALVPTDAMQLKYNIFKDNVKLFCYGDDGIFSVRDEYLRYYNMCTITEYFKDYGIVATDANKSEAIVEVEDVSSAQFLKRGFALHPSRPNTWLSPLKWESIVSCTQWVWNSENMKDATRVNANAALMESYTHGPEKFVEFKRAINRALRKRKIAPVTGMWEDFDKLFFDQGFEFNIDAFILNN